MMSITYWTWAALTSVRLRVTKGELWLVNTERVLIDFYTGDGVGLNLTTTSSLILLQSSPWHLQHPVLRMWNKDIEHTTGSLVFILISLKIQGHFKILMYLSMRSLSREECWARTAWWYISLCPPTTRISWQRQMSIRSNLEAQNNMKLHLGKAGWQCPRVQAPWWMVIG